MGRDKGVHQGCVLPSQATVVNGPMESDNRRKRSLWCETLSPGTSGCRAGGQMSQFRAKL